MNLRSISATTLTLLSSVLFSSSSYSQQYNIEPSWGESVISVPPRLFKNEVTLEATVFRPPGAGPFPLAVINHGASTSGPRSMERFRPDALVRAFLSRGYMVYAPMRAGYSNSAGSPIDPFCADTYGFAETNAASISQAVSYIVSSNAPIDRNRMVVVGHSVGGISSLAYARSPHAGVRGILNLAGGWRSSQSQAWCDWQGHADKAFRQLGAEVRLPAFFQYVGNDQDFFPQNLASRWLSEYQRGGGRASNAILQNVNNSRINPHNAWFDQAEMDRAWNAGMSQFLSSIGMPTRVVYPQFASGSDPLPAATLPQLSESTVLPDVASDDVKQFFAEFLSDTRRPRAFVMSEDGAYGYYRAGQYRPANQALRLCKQAVGPNGRCKVFAASEKVVWSQGITAPNER